VAGRTPATQGFVQSRGTGWFRETREDLLSILGPGKLVDTSKHFVVVMDSLGNGILSVLIGVM
jgi:homoserine acetyltransferase